MAAAATAAVSAFRVHTALSATVHHCKYLVDGRCIDVPDAMLQSCTDGLFYRLPTSLESAQANERQVHAVRKG
jgi:hypothetical protein